MQPLMIMYRLLKPEAFKDLVSYVAQNTARQLQDEVDLFNIPGHEAAPLIDGWIVKQFGGNDEVYKVQPQAAVARSNIEPQVSLDLAQHTRGRVSQTRPEGESLAGLFRNEWQAQARNREREMRTGRFDPNMVGNISLEKAKELERSGAVNGNVLAVNALLAGLNKPLEDK